MTNSQNLFLQSISIGLRQWRMAAIVYLIQLCLALTLGMQVFEVLQASIGHSLEINKLMTHYDHTVITDFLKVHGSSITPLIGQLRWLLLVWLIFSVFLNAGLLSCAALGAGSKQAPVRTFWKGGAEYFFPFLKISLLFLLKALLWTGIAWLPVLVYLEPSLEYFSSEQYSVWACIGILSIYLAGLAILYLASLSGKISKIKTDAPIATSVKSGWKALWRHKKQFLVFLMGIGLIQTTLLGLYWILEATIGMTSLQGMLLLLIFQQFCVFFRIQLRQICYTGICLIGP